jgi:hypothetical protein
MVNGGLGDGWVRFRGTTNLTNGTNNRCHPGPRSAAVLLFVSFVRFVVR